MGRRIVVYGNGDKTRLGFPTAQDFRQWIKEDVFAKFGGRYHYTQGKDADVIVLSRDGLAHGHFEIEDKVMPDEKDRQVYPRVKFTYIVRSSVLYEKPVHLAALRIRVCSFGRPIDEVQFARIKALGL